MPRSTCYAVAAATLLALPAAATPASAPALAVTVAGADASAPALPAGRAGPTAATAAPAPARALKLTDETIRRAIRATLDADKAGEPAGTPAVGALSAGAPRAERYQRFAETFSSARIPGCLRPDGLKFQPFLPFDLLSLSFIAVAKVRGKCK